MKSPEILREKHIQTISDGTNTSVNDNNIHSPNHNLSNIQLKKNHTGLPDKLKSGIENLSGHSLDDVKVHYNSSKPAQLQAHAYAQGTDIHLASGQEKHLPHEAWHVVQQKQGRVKPTMQMKGKVNINDNATLEKEADLMGAKALQFKKSHLSTEHLAHSSIKSPTAQRVAKEELTTEKRAIVESDEFKEYIKARSYIKQPYDQWLKSAGPANLDTHIKGFNEAKVTTQRPSSSQTGNQPRRSSTPTTSRRTASTGPSSRKTTSSLGSTKQDNETLPAQSADKVKLDKFFNENGMPGMVGKQSSLVSEKEKGMCHNYTFNDQSLSDLSDPSDFVNVYERKKTPPVTVFLNGDSIAHSAKGHSTVKHKLGERGPVIESSAHDYAQAAGYSRTMQLPAKLGELKKHAATVMEKRKVAAEEHAQSERNHDDVQKYLQTLRDAKKE